MSETQKARELLKDIELSYSYALRKGKRAVTATPGDASGELTTDESI
jgi:hypothetical protein